MHHSQWRVRIWPGNLRSINKVTSFFGDRKVAGFVSLSMPFSQHCGAIYLRSESYLGFEIFSDILTKHCCQVCVLLVCLWCFAAPTHDCADHADMVSDGAIGKTWVPRGLTLRQANAGNDMENILYVWFSHFTLTDTRVFCPQLISNVRSRRRIDSSSIIAHPVNFDEHLWTISTNSGRYR